MKSIIRLLLCLGIVLCVAASGADALLLCGGSEVFIIDEAQAGKIAYEKTWSWRAKDRGELPEKLRASFATTDDCKSADGGRKVLISSSSGGCAVVERLSGRVLWYAHVPTAHSLDLLPRDRIVVAASNAKRLIVYDLAKPDSPVWETTLNSAHGAVWDKTRQCLWALGYDTLQCYVLKDWDSANPSLELKASHPLPGVGGHDLQPVPNSADLVVTNHKNVYLFDREKRIFKLHPELGELSDVKAVSIHGETGRVVYVQATDHKIWWTDTIHFLAPQGKIQLEKERLYKARWAYAPATAAP